MGATNEENEAVGEVRSAGSGTNSVGTVSSDLGSDSESTGFHSTGDGSNTVRGDSNRVKGKWLAIATALATVVYILAELVGIATGNKERFKDIQHEVNDTIPAVGRELDNLENVIQDLQEQVAGIPTEYPTPPPTEVVVESGKDGAPGKTTVIMPKPQERTVYVTPSAPPSREPVTPNARPTNPPQQRCTLPLGRDCVIPNASN